MRAEVLGDLRLASAEGREPVPSGLVGRLLRWLLLRPNEVHGHDQLCRRLWPGPEPDGRLTRDRLYVGVSRVRRFLDRDGEDAALRVVTEPHGYRLDAPQEALDSVAFETLAREALEGDDPAKAAQALSLWRGDPYVGWPFADEAERQRARLQALRREVERVAGPERVLPVRELLARTKFLPPTVGSTSLAVRQRLLDRMGNAGETSLVVLAAPAGYGKSVLLAQWGEMQAGPVAWVTLESSDNDPIRYWSAVLQSLVETGAIDPAIVPPDVAPGSERFLRYLAGAITAVETPIALVLDDVHHLTNGGLHEGLEACLEHLPGRLTVAVAVRPPLPFDPHDRMGHDRLRVITASELRFDADEVREVAEGNGAGPDAEQLVEVTEGWPIAVSYMSRLGISVARDEAWNDGTLRRYVVEEVVQELPVDVRSFLLETAHLDRLSIGLCDAVTGRGDADRQIEWLRDNQLFLVEMGSESGMYRYHHLVRDVLRQATDDASFDVALRHRRAAHWYREQDLLEDALRHALAGGDDATVAAVAGDVLWANINRGEVYTCRSWLHAIDPDVLAADRESHDVATLTAGGWLEPDRRAEWSESRRRNYGESDDLIVFCHEGHRAYLEGRARDCVVVNDEALALVDAYFDRHPGRPGMRDILVRTLEMSKVSGRILGGALHHEDPALRDLARTFRDGMPLMQLWLHGEWSFLAYVEGAPGLAGELLDEVRPHLASMDVTSTHLSAGRLLVSASLLESDRSADPDAQRRIASRLRPMVRLYRTLRWDVELIPVLLALHVACHRAGEVDEAAARANEADVLLALCDDAPLLVEARLLLDMRDADRQSSDPEDLTEREREVLEHLSAALTYDQIAEKMDVSRHTVAGHVKATYRKLGVHSRHGALRRHRERHARGR